ncbi:hypothetical protein B484DRAFT_479581, partial [Ochromonadaceae sp. CCMP2298]
MWHKHPFPSPQSMWRIMAFLRAAQGGGTGERGTEEGAEQRTEVGTWEQGIEGTEGTGEQEGIEGMEGIKGVTEGQGGEGNGEGTEDIGEETMGTRTSTSEGTKGTKMAEGTKNKGTKGTKGKNKGTKHKVRMVDFLLAVGGDCCYIRQGPGTEMLVVPVDAAVAQHS